jgi:hypothetical protein
MIDRKRFISTLGAGMLLALCGQSALAAIGGSAAPATRYDVTIKSVEICSDANCTTAVQVGSGTRVFDIASATAGADVGSYADISGIPVGRYSHVRVTIDAQLTLVGSGSDGAIATCATGGAAGTHTATGAGVVGGTPAAQTLFIPDENVATFVAGAVAGPTTADYAAYNISKPVAGGDVIITYPLSRVIDYDGTNLPLITITFDTQNALGVVDTSGGGPAACEVFPRPPEVTITAN